MTEQEKQEKIGTFKSATEGLVKLFETQADGLRQMSEVLEHRAALADARTKELDERLMKVARREAEVGAIRQIAADRKVQMEIAQDGATKANEARKKAEVEMRLAKEEKARLEGVLAGLLKEKNELAAQLAQATAQKLVEVQA